MNMRLNMTVLTKHILKCCKFPAVPGEITSCLHSNKNT